MSRHDLDPSSLLPGLLFLALGAIGLLGAAGREDATRWIVPMAVIALGVVGLVSALTRPRPAPAAADSAALADADERSYPEPDHEQ